MHVDLWVKPSEDTYSRIHIYHAELNEERGGMIMIGGKGAGRMHRLVRAGDVGLGL